MQAVVAQRYGGPEALDVVERPDPVPDDRDVRILHATFPLAEYREAFARARSSAVERAARSC